MTIRAIISDIDGCLAPESSNPLNAAALATLADHNHRAQRDHDRPIITLCSGRPQPFVEALCRLIANRTLPAIAENGVWLWHPATNRYDIDPAITADHLDAIDDIRRYVRRDLEPLGVVMQPGKAASVSLYHEHTQVLRDLMPAFRQRAERERWPVRLSMTWLYINCDLAHISKATAIARFKASTGLATPDLAGIGDTPSDKAIAQHVAFFAIPSNADEAIKPNNHPATRYVSPHPEIEGVLDILTHLPRT
jgi:hydroxymethylpyrimidine pyrophosphatase-like HAD family hydrolase